MLHLEEALVDEGLTLPRMDVLSYQSVTDELKHLANGNGDIVPTLLLADPGQRVHIDEAYNFFPFRLIPHLLLELFCTRIAMSRNDVAALVMAMRAV